MDIKDRGYKGQGYKGQGSQRTVDIKDRGYKGQGIQAASQQSTVWTSVQDRGNKQQTGRYMDVVDALHGYDGCTGHMYKSNPLGTAAAVFATDGRGSGEGRWRHRER